MSIAPDRPDQRPLHEAFSREQRSQDANNAAAQAANRAQHAAREAQFNRPGVAQPGSFTQPGGKRGK